jgi:hypothetical protein
MFRDVDPEVISSYAILLISLGLIAGIVLEYTRIYAEGIDYGVAFGGIVLILYAIGASIYIALTPSDRA